MPSRGLELPSLSGVSMSPRAWTLMESHELPQGAPELIKPRRPHRHAAQQPDPSDAVARQFAAAQLHAAIGPPPSHRIPTPQPSRVMPPHAGEATTTTSPRRRGRPTQRAQVVIAGTHVVELEHAAPPMHGLRQHRKQLANMPPRAAPSPEEIALSLGELSGARTCQALLRGDIAPAAVSRSVAAMPPELLPEFFEDFAMCIHFVGSMLPAKAMRALAPEPL